jgi:hypothetical protein
VGYKVRSLIQFVARFDNVSVGSGTIVNDPQRGYDAVAWLPVESARWLVPCD